VARRIAFIGLCLAALVLAPSTALATTGWTKPVVIHDGNFREPSLVVDRHGASHVAVTGDTGIWYLTNATGSWVRTRLTTATGHLVDVQPSIAIDSATGALVVAFVEVDTGGAPECRQLRYVVHRAGSWSSPRSATPRNQATCDTVSPSVATRNGRIWIAADITGFACGECLPATGFRLLTNASGSWKSQSVGVHVGAVTAESSLALDSHARPLVIFQQRSSVWYARGTTMAGDFVLGRVGFGRRPAIAVDHHDRVRLAFRRGQATYYATHGAAGWHATKILDFAARASIGIDGRGRVRIAAIAAGSSASRAVWYATDRTGAWHSVRLFRGPAGDMVALGVSPTDRTSVAYENVTTERVLFQRSLR
jgi:hypothetical protein